MKLERLLGKELRGLTSEMLELKGGFEPVLVKNRLLSVLARLQIQRQQT
jgi:hypothetical protein